jgi:peptide-N4-(N-acetyl-beta-glucosaminyl)asparagine amidase
VRTFLSTTYEARHQAIISNCFDLFLLYTYSYILTICTIRDQEIKREMDEQTARDESLARQLQEEEDNDFYHKQQRERQNDNDKNNSNQNLFMQKLYAAIETIKAYEDEYARAMALSCVPIDELEERKSSSSSSSSLGKKDRFVVELLKWFKHEFFEWCDKPKCSKCSQTGTNMTCIGMAKPTEDDLEFGANRVEMYQCANCYNARTQFPRYNNCVKLLETRTGRCGEYANAFTLLLRALNYEARYVMDWTDHVWTEVWSEEQNRWIHCDSCEASFDEPRLYSEGWGKKLSYVVAFSIEGGVTDVSRRYQKMDDNMIERRRAIVQDEEFVKKATLIFTNQLRHSLIEERRTALRIRDEEEIEELRMIDMTEAERSKNRNLPGRLTGSLEWRKARGELGHKAGSEEEKEKEEAQVVMSNTTTTTTTTAESNLKDKITKEFWKLRNEGISPNEAAARAAENIRERLGRM